MPYYENDLAKLHRFIPRVNFRNGNSVNLSNFQSALQEECDANGVPVAFKNEILKTGNLFNRQSENILILYNPDHPKYLNFLLRVTRQGNYAFLDVFQVGASENLIYDQADIQRSTIYKVFNAFSGNSAKIQEEKDYYTILEDCMMNVVK